MKNIMRNYDIFINPPLPNEKLPLWQHFEKFDKTTNKAFSTVKIINIVNIYIFDIMINFYKNKFKIE